MLTLARFLYEKDIPHFLFLFGHFSFGKIASER